ncbi:Rhodanese-like protein [Trypanosoma rangeli]|uniref:Rhodanese-like protein n=1 Tax=Trypanosoma rangeli TaxID=5698 RepID=A0A422MX25_TRYRA|nr:Rhodanese-like protein [Trypanosoma rangeli]RNE97757.1 Rhodanese-like protein [Trypanosoma rangeli]|eukprot:RNE97757.1 Rhodanese-like protein [Trypanosoma rangeli]
MWRRFCVRRVAAVLALQQRAPLRRGLLLRLTGLVLSTGHMERGWRGRMGMEEESAEQLAAEVKTTRSELQLMAAEADMQQTGSERIPGVGEKDWTEPTLEDLDRSIPQVDCAFIANLIRARTARRKEFLQKKTKVNAKVAALSKRQASSVLQAVKFPVLGAGRGRGNVGSSDGLTAVTGGSNGDDEDAVVTASPEVVAQLTDEERDVLLHSRPEYDDGFVLLDCRTVNEVTSWGMIEGAKLLPAHEMFDGFHLTPEEFEVEFGFTKPRPEQKVICYCQYGPRSLMAAQILTWMGYMNVLHFRDGYYEWGKQYNLLLRRWRLHGKESGNEDRR